jgi:hypothetical protein
MSNDLMTAIDHPVTILRLEGRRLNDLTPNEGMGSGMRNAAEHLSDYERDHGVTFVALDNDALKAVDKALDDVIDRQGMISAERVRALRAAIADLLGK